MDRSSFTDRLGGLRDRLPGGDDDDDESGSTIPSPPVPDATPELPDAAPDVDLPDPRLTDSDDDSRISLGLTILTLLGLAIAAVAALARFALDRVRSDGSDDAKSTPDPSDSDTGFQFGHDASATGVADETGTDTAARDEGEAVEREAESEAEETDHEPAETAHSMTEQLRQARGEDEEGPRIAPLVGMAAQVGVRLFVEKLRDRTDDGSTAD
jgi:hypothetical protein